MKNVFIFFYLWLRFSPILSLTENSTVSSKIIGGYDCSTEDYPFIVSIRFKKNWRGHICGGTLIKRDWVLTAAHCLNFGEVNPKQLVVIIHTSKIKINGEESKPVRNIYIHPKSDVERFHYDIALLRLSRPFRRKLQLVQLPSFSTEEDISSLCTELLMMGWGSTIMWDPEEKAMQSMISFDGQLRCIYLPVLPAAMCQKYINPMDVNTFCTLHKKGGKDSCIGDSGGPVMCRGIQYGIISHAYGCALENEPSLNVRVDRMLDFIDGVLKSQGPNYFQFDILLLLISTLLPVC